MQSLLSHQKSKSKGMRLSFWLLCLLLSLACGSLDVGMVSTPQESCIGLVRSACERGVLEYSEFESVVAGIVGVDRCDPGYLWSCLLFEEDASLCQTVQGSCQDSSLPLKGDLATAYCADLLCKRINAHASAFQCTRGYGFLDAYDFTTLVAMLAPRSRRLLEATEVATVAAASCAPDSKAVVLGVASGIITFLSLLMVAWVFKQVDALRKTIQHVLEEDATTKTSVESPSLEGSIIGSQSGLEEESSTGCSIRRFSISASSLRELYSNRECHSLNDFIKTLSNILEDGASSTSDDDPSFVVRVECDEENPMTTRELGEHFQPSPCAGDAATTTAKGDVSYSVSDN